MPSLWIFYLSIGCYVKNNICFESEILWFIWESTKFARRKYREQSGTIRPMRPLIIKLTMDKARFVCYYSCLWFILLFYWNLIVILLLCSILQPGKLLPSAHAVEREYRVMKALKQQGVPVPTMLGLCEDSRWGTSN